MARTKRREAPANPFLNEPWTPLHSAVWGLARRIKVLELQAAWLRSEVDRLTALRPPAGKRVHRT